MLCCQLYPTYRQREIKFPVNKRMRVYYTLLYIPWTSYSHACQLLCFSETACPTVLLAQSLKVIHGFLLLWPSVLSHVNFDLRKLLPGQQEMTFPPVVQQLTLQILLQAPPGSIKWYHQVSITRQFQSNLLTHSRMMGCSLDITCSWKNLACIFSTSFWGG